MFNFRKDFYKYRQCKCACHTAYLESIREAIGYKGKLVGFLTPNTKRIIIESYTRVTTCRCECDSSLLAELIAAHKKNMDEKRDLLDQIESLKNEILAFAFYKCTKCKDKGVAVNFACDCKNEAYSFKCNTCRDTKRIFDEDIFLINEKLMSGSSSCWVNLKNPVKECPDCFKPAPTLESIDAKLDKLIHGDL